MTALDAGVLVKSNFVPNQSRPAALRHIPSLDGIRAISVLLVFAAHGGLAEVVPGALGVTTFFFLSGFLITTLMRSELERTGSVNLRHFWLRRVLRILPPFYLVALTLIAISPWLDGPGQLRPAAVAAQLLQVSNYWLIFHGYQGQPAGTSVFWSLAVEEHFYLLFPWIYVGMQRLHLSRPKQAATLWALCALVLVWRCVLVYGFHVSTDRTYYATDTRVDSILFGCALAIAWNPILDITHLNERIWKYIILPLACAALLFCLVYRDSGFRETWRYSLQGAALSFVFVAAIKFKDWLPFRFLNLPYVAFVGVLSYSIYLVHFPILFAFGRSLPSVNGFVIALLSFSATLVVAWLIYRLVEQPCARLRKRLID